jgi:hypothetical protein
LHAAVYDPTGDRMVIHGGVNLGGTHALDLATLTWSTLFNIGPEIYHAAAVYDPVRQRMVLTGGNGIVSQPGGVYALSLKTPAFWASAPVGGLAFNRYEHTAAFDPDLDLVMIFGGRLYDLSGLTSDPWRLDCAGGFWLQTAGDQGKVNAYPPKACYSPGEPVTLQAVGNADYAFSQWAGDASGTSSVIDITMNANMAILAQFHTGPVGVGEMPLSFALEDIHPNPNSGPVQVTFVLPREARVKLAVYDLSGRIVGRLVDGSMVAGRHTATWDGRTNGVAAAAGIYFVRFDTPAGSWVHRVALLR